MKSLSLLGRPQAIASFRVTQHISTQAVKIPVRHTSNFQQSKSSRNISTAPTAVKSIENGEKVATPDLPPHSILPSSMLIRAALVNTISSKPLLLGVALKTLTYLTQSRLAVFNVSKNPILHAVLKQTFYNHFCAGGNGVEVERTITKLKDIGFKGVILTYAREIVVDANLEEKGKGMVVQEKSGEENGRDVDVDAWRDGVMMTVNLLGQEDFLALKMTGAGKAVMESLSKGNPISRQMSEALEEVCTCALQRNVRVLIDAEQQSVQNGIDSIALDLMCRYNQNGKVVVYNTYQAYLKSTPTTLTKHLQLAHSEGFALGIKLVRGAYMASEPRKLINDTKPDTDHAYDSIAEGLLTKSYTPFTSPESRISADFPPTALFLATHNKDSAMRAYHLTQSGSSSQNSNPVQYGQLLGMADEVSCELLQMGQKAQATNSQAVPEVYKCLSWGTLEDCLSYLLRRARENQDAAGRTQSEYKAVWAEIRRRIKGSFGMA